MKKKVEVVYFPKMCPEHKRPMQATKHGWYCPLCAF